MELNWNFQGVKGCKMKNLPWGEYIGICMEHYCQSSVPWTKGHVHGLSLVDFDPYLFCFWRSAGGHWNYDWQ